MMPSFLFLNVFDVDSWMNSQVPGQDVMFTVNIGWRWAGCSESFFACYKRGNTILSERSTYPWNHQVIKNWSPNCHFLGCKSSTTKRRIHFLLSVGTSRKVAETTWAPPTLLSTQVVSWGFGSLNSSPKINPKRNASELPRLPYDFKSPNSKAPKIIQYISNLIQH